MPAGWTLLSTTGSAPSPTQRTAEEEEEEEEEARQLLAKARQQRSDALLLCGGLRRQGGAGELYLSSAASVNSAPPQPGTDLCEVVSLKEWADALRAAIMASHQAGDPPLCTALAALVRANTNSPSQKTI
jgi:predicted amidohydrolase YtcJ